MPIVLEEASTAGPQTYVDKEHCSLISKQSLTNKLIEHVTDWLMHCTIFELYTNKVYFRLLHNQY